jgi:hypothetical protein
MSEEFKNAENLLDSEDVIFNILSILKFLLIFYL